MEDNSVAFLSCLADLCPPCSVDGGRSRVSPLPILGNLPAHCYALWFPQLFVWSPAELQGPNKVKHPSRLELGLTTMDHVPGVRHGTYSSCAECATGRAVLRGCLTLPYGKEHLHHPPQPQNTAAQAVPYLSPAPHRCQKAMRSWW